MNLISVLLGGELLVPVCVGIALNRRIALL